MEKRVLGKSNSETGTNKKPLPKQRFFMFSCRRIFYLVAGALSSFLSVFFFDGTFFTSFFSSFLGASFLSAFCCIGFAKDIPANKTSEAIIILSFFMTQLLLC